MKTESTTDRTWQEDLRQLLPGPQVLAAGLMLVAFFVWFYWSSFGAFRRTWSQDDYQHGPFVPLFSLFLLWYRRDMIIPFVGRGSWWGLALAVGAAAVLDALLLASFGWSELIGQNLRITAWVVFAAAWVVAVGWSIRERRRQAVLREACPRQDAFLDALEQYLKGDYYQAEQLLGGLLDKNARDLEARLMLATLLRHAGRAAEAAGQLDALGRLEGAEKWRVEIEEERQLLTEAGTLAVSAA